MRFFYDPQLAQRGQGGAGRIVIRTWLMGVTMGVAAACAGPRYVSQNHAALQTPVALGDGDTGKPPLPEPLQPQETTADAPDATLHRPATPGHLASAGSLPDPEAQPTSVYYDVWLRYCQQRVHVIGSQRTELTKPVTLPARMGRFALEVGVGHQLLERARFDFPLLGVEVPERTLQAPPLFGPKADVARRVRVADQPRATWARVVDRATEEAWPLTWPPQLGAPEEASPTSESALTQECPMSAEPGSAPKE